MWGRNGLGESFLTDAVRAELDDITLTTFCQRYYLPNNGRNKGKITAHDERVQRVVVFVPRPPANPDGPRYVEFCTNSLMKFKAWRDRPLHLKLQADLVAAGEEGEGLQQRLDDAIKAQWEQFFDSDEGRQNIGAFERDACAIARLGAREGGDDDDDDRLGGLSIDDQAEGGDDDLAVCRSILLERLEGGSQHQAEWSQDHDWSVPAQRYADREQRPIGDRLRGVQASVGGAEHEVRRREVLRNTLRGKQGVAHDIFVQAVTAKVRNETCPPEQQQPLPAPMNNGNALMLLLGFGGSGKSWTIDAIVHTLTSTIPSKRVMVVATTGKAASQIQGSTVHSWKHGLCLPVSFHTKRALSLRSKQAFQQRMQNVMAIILDEYSMLCQEDMYWLDFRLKEAFPERSNQPFGGVPILLAGE
jgi:hypothetical protein